MNYSLTIGGIIIMVAGTLLVEWGFSESCAGEITTKVPLALGAVVAWIGRVRAGGITLLGFKKE